MKPVPALASLALGAALLLGVAQADPVQSSPRATGGLRLPDLDQEAPMRLKVARRGTSYRLGFQSAVKNVGTGPLIIEGQRRSHATQAMTAAQLIPTSAGAYRVANVGELRFVHSSDHQHWHLLGFDRYELRRAGEETTIVADHKTGFCLGDRYRIAGRVLPNAARAKVYRSNCGKHEPWRHGIREGISVGWGDDYKAFLEGQELLLDGLGDGQYVVVHRVNADGRLRELTDRNNAASVLFDLTWRAGKPSIRVLASCPDRSDCEFRPS